MFRRALSATMYVVLFTLALVGARYLVSNLDSGTCYAADACEGDFDSDGDVDGSDLAVFAADFGRTDCPSSVAAPVERTGQTTSYATGDDGDLEKGVAWPHPRFTDNGDGTVTDNLTGLIWLKNANCFGTRSWSEALTDCNNLADGACGLTDGSVAGDWRLPNVKELQSLIHHGVYLPILPDTAGTGKWTEGDPFSGVQSSVYWSATTMARNTGVAWYVYLYHGTVYYTDKTVNNYVWPVRGGK